MGNWPRTRRCVPWRGGSTWSTGWLPLVSCVGPDLYRISEHWCHGLTFNLCTFVLICVFARHDHVGSPIVVAPEDFARGVATTLARSGFRAARVLTRRKHMETLWNITRILKYHYLKNLNDIETPNLCTDRREWSPAVASNCHQLPPAAARVQARWASSLNALPGIATVSRPAVGLSFGEPWLPWLPLGPGHTSTWRTADQSSQEGCWFLSWQWWSLSFDAMGKIATFKELYGFVRWLY